MTLFHHHLQKGDSMKRFLRFLAVGVLFGLPQLQAQPQLFFKVSLDSAKTGGTSPGRGTGYGVLSSDLKSLTYSITVNNLVGNITNAHFHYGPNGSVIQAITFTGKTAAGTWSNISDTLLKHLFNQNIYVNVHTSSNTAGEIRGNVDISQFGFSVKIDSTGAGTGSPARGDGWLSLGKSSGGAVLNYQFTYAGLRGTRSNAHFHYLPTGGVLQAITFTDSTSIGSWTMPDSVITHLLRGRIYVNIHSTAHTGGEIRGIPAPVGEIAAYAAVDGAQASTASTAKGTVWAVLSNDLSKIKYSITYAKLSSAFAGGHFHSSPGGSVVHGYTFGSGNTATGDWTGLTDANIQDLVRGRIYANIHSSTNSGGEIRGNMIMEDGVFTTTLTGAQAGTSSSARGTGVLWYSNDTLRYHITFAGLSGTFSAGHIHNAPSGTVLFPLTFTDSSSGGNWNNAADSIVSLIIKGKLYYNVHSSTNSGGEIRGNIGLGSVVVTGVEQISANIPAAFELQQNYPNPFNPSTSINFSVNNASHVSLKVFNLLGQEVAALMDEVKAPGTYKVTFDARSLTTGIYFYKLTANNFAETRKMVLLK